MRKVHQEKIDESILTFLYCRRFIEKQWGPTPKDTKWLYTANKTHVNRPQRLASLNITGAMRIAQTAPLETFLAIPSLQLFIQEEKAGLRLQRRGIWKSSFNEKSNMMILRSVHDVPLLAAPVDKILPKMVLKRKSSALVNDELQSTDHLQRRINVKT